MIIFYRVIMQFPPKRQFGIFPPAAHGQSEKKSKFFHFDFYIFAFPDKEDTRKKKKEDEKKKTTNPGLLLAFSYFDQNHCGYLLDRDTEDIIHTLGLKLSRAQVSKQLIYSDNQSQTSIQNSFLKKRKKETI